MTLLRQKRFFLGFSLLAILGLGFGCRLSASPEVGNESDTTTTFRWIHENTDPNVWKDVLAAFENELRPDEAKTDQSDLDTYRYKYVQRIGVVSHSVLVIIGRRPAKEVSKENAWDEYHTAFNFDLITKRKAPIEHAEVMWQWKFAKLAKFGPSPIPDITFTYLTCTECEPEKMFSSLSFDQAKGMWKVRSWGDGKELWWTANDGLVVDIDLAASDTISFDCVYGIRDLKGTGFEGLVMRCKEIGYKETDTLRIEDATVVYTLVDGQLNRRRVTDDSEVAQLTARICLPNSSSLLCKLPGYMTITSGQNAALLEWFPNVPKTVRDLTRFRKIQKTMSMKEVASKYGRPDELGGSGIAIFIYHLDDGSLVAIGATGTTGPLLYANHITSSGKSTALFPAE